MNNVVKTSDRVDVIRCRECWKLGFDNCPMEDYWDSHPADYDFYCAAGEPESKRPVCKRGYCDIQGDNEQEV